MFCPDSTIVHIDIDASEITQEQEGGAPHPREREGTPSRFSTPLWPLKAGNANPPATRTPEWFGVIEDWKKQYPFSYEDRKGYISPQAVIEELYRQTADKDPIICTGVGQHQMFAAQFFKLTSPVVWLPPAAWEPWATAFPPPWACAWPVRTSWW